MKSIEKVAASGSTWSIHYKKEVKMIIRSGETMSQYAMSSLQLNPYPVSGLPKRATGCAKLNYALDPRQSNAMRSVQQVASGSQQ